MYLSLMGGVIIFFLPIFILVLIGVRLIYRHETAISLVGILLFWGSVYLIASVLMISFVWGISPFLCEMMIGIITLLLAWFLRFVMSRYKQND